MSQPTLRSVSTEAVVPGTQHKFVLAKSLRVHQWIKNLLVFVPLLMAHKVLDVRALTHTVYAFVAWCLCASAVYLLNDLLDLEADKSHPVKRHGHSRPERSGKGCLDSHPFTRAAGLAIAFLLLPGRLVRDFALSRFDYRDSIYLKRMLMIACCCSPGFIHFASCRADLHRDSGLTLACWRSPCSCS